MSVLVYMKRRFDSEHIQMMLMDKEVSSEKAQTQPVVKRKSSSLYPSSKVRKGRRRNLAAEGAGLAAPHPRAERRRKRVGRNTSETGLHLAPGKRGDTDRAAQRTNTKTRINRKRGPLVRPLVGVHSVKAAAVVPVAPLMSSTRSTSESPARLDCKHKTDGQKASSTSLSPGPNSLTAWHNGDHTQRSRNGKASRLNHTEGEKGHDKLRLLTASSARYQSTLLREHKPHSLPSRSQTGPVCAAGEAGSVEGRNTAIGSSAIQTPGRGRGSQRGQNKSSHSPAHSSDSAHSQHNHTHRGRNSRHQRKTKGGHSSKRHHRSSRGQAHHRSPSASPGRHSHVSGRKKEEERDSPNRSDTDSRARRRSRSYSPISKRRRDSPSFMEARRITSARKRPIPYYRPSPSSSSYDSSPSRSSRSRSRSYSSYSRSRSHSRSHSRSRSRSRSWSRSRSQSRSWSRSRSRSRSHHSYYSRSSYDSPGF
ncbi:serine/arginine repetitive matrix protein 3 [Lates japonicus]|uniref:Serine/arginine repetitive matrix protein 3 n=1 Tax=Lates japonicus TaxID=270547 RepID=A0AAD3NM78_LATJO|nr:serine/arginine repetitive matrix protein 3 [Lates japonicus]